MAKPELDDSAAPSHDDVPSGMGAVGADGVRRYRYREFGDEREAEFDDAHLAWSGKFESSSSSGHSDYKDRLRAIQLRKTGLGKADIAKDLGRSEKFVARWWQMEPMEVPRPPGVHQYLAHSMMDGKQQDRTDMWRGVEVVRGFIKDTEGLYEEITEAYTQWKQTASETKDFRTASYFLRYDREGKMRFMSMKSTNYIHGVVPRLDSAVQKMHRKCGIDDTNHGAGMYWFSDGDASVGSHRHVFSTARLALGSDRILMVDKTPILMQEGDLVILGPQRHGVPSMPDISEGHLRITVPFTPTNKGKQATRPVEDSHVGAGTGTAPEAGCAGDEEAAESMDSSGAVPQLVALGFDAGSAEGALRFFGWDVERAAESLLSGEYAEVLAGLDSGGFDDEQYTEEEWAAWQEQVNRDAHFGGQEHEDGWIEQDDSDAAFAHRLQMQELREEHSEVPSDEQFAECDRIAGIDDAEREWDGYGDLMHDSFRRANLSLASLGPQTLFSIGAVARTERLFFEVLAQHSIRVLYDFRATDYRDEIRSKQPHFEIRALKSCCKARGILYRHVAIGRETAYGVLRHMKSDEVRHILVELVWQAKHGGHTAFLGHEDDWKADHRLAIAEDLVKYGHRVEHLDTGGACETHVAGMPMPDFLVQEEARLRKIHAQRKAGELRRPEKSAVDRSSEAVARTLATDKVAVDVGAELRDAVSQDELARAQKRMVRMRVAEDKKEAGLSKKILLSVPAHIAQEALEKRAKLDAKAKGDKEKQRLDSSLPDEGSGSASSKSEFRLASAGTASGCALSESAGSSQPSSSSCVAVGAKQSDELLDIPSSSGEQPDSRLASTGARKIGRWSHGTAAGQRPACEVSAVLSQPEEQAPPQNSGGRWGSRRRPDV